MDAFEQLLHRDIDEKEYKALKGFDIGVRVKSKGSIGAGTIVHISGQHLGVEFDKNHGGHDCNGKAKRGHGWYYHATEIELLEEGST